METIIPAGYRVTVNSWENDGDAKRVVVKEGLSHSRAALYVDFARLFYSQNNYHGPKGFGNMYEPRKAELAEAHAAVKDVLIKHFAAFCEMWGEEYDVHELDNEDALHDFAGELHYELFGASEYKFRVLESIKVEHIPFPITMQDVTKEF